ncbi:hypothetical protein [Deinococcus navajonensis]|uniref:Uncharacterized protein n=1 Tax=Deinococcus navajonensis TaxID=309884 RepID=A0ABV8XKG8_9DEIO
MPTIQRLCEDAPGPSALQGLMVRRQLRLLGQPDHEVLEAVTRRVTDPGLMRDMTLAKVGLDPAWPGSPCIAARHDVSLARAVAAGREGLRRVYRALLDGAPAEPAGGPGPGTGAKRH